MRGLRVVASVVVLLVMASGCAFTGSALRHASAPGQVAEPWWCAPSGAVALDATTCTNLSAQLDGAQLFAHQHLHVSDATGAGATGSAYVTGVGAAYRFHAPTATFDANQPDTLLYDGTDPASQVAGMEWNVVSASAPGGFVGPNDVWTDTGDNVWQLRVWALRPFQNQPNVFADTHACLGASGPIYDLSDPCYTSTHPRPFEVLVTNDDSYAAPGIDAVVQALRALPNVHVTVSAPATNQSGVGDKTTPGGVSATLLQTASGYPAWAANGTPADSVLYALNVLHADPELVVSGSNQGQNLGTLIKLSGTVGAARTGARALIPAVAVSQGFANPLNAQPPYAPSVGALMTWVDGFLFGREGPARLQSVVNINAPTCSAGLIRGTLELPLATVSKPFNPSDCTSTVNSFADDIDGFVNGYITISSVGT